MFLKRLFLIVLLTVSFPASSQSNVEKASRFLQDLRKLSENVNTNGDLEERRKIVQGLSKSVDFEALARKALGIHWQKTTKAKRDEFLQVLRELVEKVLYPRAKRIHSKVEEIKFSPIPGRPANVKAETNYEYEKKGDIVTRSIEIELIYSSSKAQAKIVDAILEGEQVSTNLHRQFSQILEKKTLDEVIDRMRLKLRESDAPARTSGEGTHAAPGAKKS